MTEVPHFAIDADDDEVLSLSLGNMRTDEEIARLTEWASDVSAEVQRRFMARSARVPILVDASHVASYLPKAFTLLSELLQKEDARVDTVAIFGASPFIVTAADMLVAFAGTRPIQSFKTKEEARAALLNPAQSGDDSTTQ